MIQLHKYVNNKYDTSFVLQLHYKSVFDKRYDTRGHRYKLVPQLCKYDLRKHFFVNRLVKIWNSLPDDVVSATQHAVLIVSRDILIRFGVVLVCIMTINPTSNTGSRCENSISLVLLIFV